MKKVLISVFAMVMVLTLAFAGCGSNEPVATPAVTDTTTVAPTDAPTVAPTDAPTVAPTVAPAEASAEPKEWSVKVGDFDIISSMVGNSVTPVTLTLQKVSKDGSMKDQECTGYKVSELLALANVGEFTTMTVVAADGFEYELDKATAMLETTLLVIEQNGEKYDLPRFAVDKGDSNAWVKDVVEFRITA